MQFRCYTCHFVFHDGPPPMEALSDQQMGLVAGSRTSADEVRLILLGTQFSGLGAANFCDSCLLAIIDNPAAFREDNEGVHTLEQNQDAIWCACGVTYWTSEKDRTQRLNYIYDRPDWVEINRLSMRHRSDA